MLEQRKRVFVFAVKESVALEDVIDNVAKEELNVSEQGLRGIKELLRLGTQEMGDCVLVRSNL